MKSVMFIDNDNAKCFHMAIQGTHKLVMMGHTNFKDHAFIKRRWVDEKMNVMGGMFKDVQGNCQKQFVLAIGSCAHFQSFRIHNNMSAKSAIEKL
jgi:hypothetical protein